MTKRNIVRRIAEELDRTELEQCRSSRALELDGN